MSKFLFAKWSLFAILIFTSFSDAAKRRPKAPDLTKGGKHDPTHVTWNLGTTGARGWTFAVEHISTNGAKQIYVTKIEAGSPASKALKVGDVIVGVVSPETEFHNIKFQFRKDARKELGRAITLAEEKKHGGKLVLNVWNKGKLREATLKLKTMGSYSDTFPYHCKKSKKIVDDACDYLMKNGLGKGIVANINALALLSTGNKKYLSKIKAHAQGVAKGANKLKFAGYLNTWRWAYSNLFLTEYYLKTKDKSVLKAIHAYSNKIAEGQSMVGIWGHEMSFPIEKRGKLTRGVVRGYGAMNQASLPAVISLVLAKKCGVRSKSVKQAIEGSAAFYSYYVDKGAIPYGAHLPYLEVHDDNGKTALAAIFFDLIGEEKPARFFTKMVLASHQGRETGHTGNYWSFLWGALAAARGGDKAVTSFMTNMCWFYELERGTKGGFIYQGKPGIREQKNGENKYLNWDCTGARILHYTLPLKKLYITGRGKKSVKKIVGSELEEAVAAGNEPIDEVKRTYGRRSVKDLLNNLASWSPIVRYRASVALGTKKGDHVVKDLIKMLESSDRYAQYGACEALRYAGRESEEAAEAVLELANKTDDMTLKFYCMYAFSSWNKGMGLHAAGKKKINEILEIAGQEHRKDPRRMIQNEICLALFGAQAIPGFPGHWNAIMSNVDSVDRAHLIPALKLLLKTENGFNRSCVGFIYDHLKEDDLEQLWNDIYQASYHQAPSGAMFANLIRKKGMELLSNHRVEEGMDLILHYARTQPQWGSQRRMGIVLPYLDKYGAHAKRVLPDLKKLLEFSKTEKNFPQNARDIKVKFVEECIKRIQKATAKPKLKSIKKYLK